MASCFTLSRRKAMTLLHRNLFVKLCFVVLVASIAFLDMSSGMWSVVLFAMIVLFGAVALRSFFKDLWKWLKIVKQAEKSNAPDLTALAVQIDIFDAILSRSHPEDFRFEERYLRLMPHGQKLEHILKCENCFSLLELAGDEISGITTEV